MPDISGNVQTSYSPPRRIASPKRTAPLPRSNPPRRSSGSSGGGRYNPPRRSSGGYGSGSSRGSGGSGGYSGGGGSSYKPSTPRAPSLKSYLSGDDAYQQVVRGGKRSLTDFLSEINRRRGEAGTTFEQTKGTMESDRVRQLQNLRDEFASRGLIQSGLYGQEQGRFQEQFETQRRALEQQQTGLVGDLLSQERNYRREQELMLEQAKQEALARRAQRYRL
jgi:hypothetical protein